MLGPKSRPTGRLSGCSSSLKKPVSAAAHISTKAPSATSAKLRQSSQSSLLACGGKSTSRSSVLSDTTASICSSSSTARNKNSSIVLSRSNSKSLTSPANKTGPPPLAGVILPVSSSNLPSAGARRVPTLAMSLRDKDNQIKLLIKERDEQKFQAELMARKAEEWEEKFVQSEVEKSHVTSEADDEVVELRRLAQELEDENRRLAEDLGKREQVLGDTQFKLDEIECEKTELKRELEYKEEQLKTMEQENQEMLDGKTVLQVSTGRAISSAKYEREIEELKEIIVARDEQMIQLRTSLEMRKNEVNNLQAHAGDLERKLKIESERSERHLKRIDEINLELKATEAKTLTKCEENDMYEKQVRQLRQELRSAEEKLEQMSLARKKDVDILHNKLTAARKGSTTPTSPQPYKTPTPQDEIVRLQMEIRDLKDQLIDREAELDCNRRDIEVMRRKMETRTLEVDCNNQELARRCQDLLEQNRQSEDTVKQLLKSTTEHSAQLIRATEDLKEANGKCIKLRDEINELESKLDEETFKACQLSRENTQLKEDNEELKEQVNLLREQVSCLNEQLSELCEQLDLQTGSLHKDREALANQVSQNEIDSAQLRHDLAAVKQDLRTSKLQTQEMVNERDRLRADLAMKEKYVVSRNDIIETLRHELEDCKKSVSEYKQKLEDLRLSQQLDTERTINNKELKSQLDTLGRELEAKVEECSALRTKCDSLENKIFDNKNKSLAAEEEELKRFDEMRQKHSTEIDALKLRLKELEDQVEEAKLVSKGTSENIGKLAGVSEKSVQKSEQDKLVGTPIEATKETHPLDSVINKQRRDDYETQIEFLNSLVVDMQRKCDDYKSRLAQIETTNIMNELDNLILSNQPVKSRVSTLRNKDLLPTTNPTPPASTYEKGMEKPSRISGRPYCDICNVYDLHHTVYCPRVTQKLVARSQVDTGYNNNNNNNNNNYIGNNDKDNVDDAYSEYEQSMESASVRQFASLRRPRNAEKPSRPYCDHCDLFGHTVRSCNMLKV